MTDDLAQRLAQLAPEEKRQLLAKLLQEKSAPQPNAISPTDRSGLLPVSDAQRRLWLLEQLGLAGNGYNVAVYLRLRGRLDRQALQDSLSEIVRRHEVLRTCYQSVDGEPRQLVQPPVPLELPVSDLQGLDSESREDMARQLTAEAIEPLFDLTEGPLIRGQLLCLDVTDHILLVTVHHIAFDGWSTGILARELSALYTAYTEGKPSPLAPLALQYGDFSVWQHERLQSQELAGDLTYWREQLQHLEPIQLPTDYPRTVDLHPEGARWRFHFGPDLTADLQQLAQSQGVTLFMLLLAAFQTLLGRYSGSERIAIGAPSAGRTHRDVEGLIGFFVNVLVLYTDLSGDPPFTELLKRVRQVTLGAYEHQEFPFDWLVEVLHPQRHFNQNPLIQAILALQQADSITPRFELPGLEAERLEFEHLTARLDLEWHAWFEGDQLESVFIYNTHLFDVTTMQRMSRQLQTLLAGIIAAPSRPLSQFPLFTEAERRGIQDTSSPEVEAALLLEPAVRMAVVLARPDEMRGLGLVAYVVLSEPFARVKARLEAHMRAALPVHMLPRAYVPAAAMPLTPDGDIDKAALLRLPIIEPVHLDRWQSYLSAMPGIEHAAVLPAEVSAAQPSLPLAALLAGDEGSRAVSTVDSSSEPASEPELAAPGRFAVQRGAALSVAPDAPETLAQALQRAARHTPASGLTYICTDGTETGQSYLALQQEAGRILAGLRQAGLKPQDKVLLQFDRPEDFIPAFWGCVLAGVVPVPMTVPPTYAEPNTAVNQLRLAWDMLGQPMVLTASHLAPAVRALAALWDEAALPVATLDELRGFEAEPDWHESHPDDLALLMFTSGSSGQPKAVMQTHRSLLNRSCGTIIMQRFSHHDISLNWMPLSHVGGLVMFHLRDVYLACRQIQAPTELILQAPLTWLDLIDRYRATITWAPNFAYGLVNDQMAGADEGPWDLSSMRFMLNGGEPIVAKTARRFLTLLGPYRLTPTAMHPAWGMSETCSGVIYSHHFSLETTSDEDRFVDLGVPIPGCSVRIADDNHMVLQEGCIGRLQVKGAPVTTGYYQNPDLNQEAFTPDGWFDTGDLGFLRHGRLTLTGRDKEVMIINGVNIPSADIEAAVEEIEDVDVSYTAACAVHVPGEDGEQLALFFTTHLADGPQRLQLIQAIRERVVRQIGVNPVYIVPVEKHDIPKTAIGKIQRSELRQRFESGAFDAQLNAIDHHTQQIRTLPDWFYRTIWRRKAVRPYPQLAPTGPYVVLLDELGLGEQLCVELEQRHQTCLRVRAGSDFACLDAHGYQMNPDDDSHYRLLFDALYTAGLWPAHVVHLWTYQADAGAIKSTEALEHAQTRGVLSLLSLVQAMAERQEETPADGTPPLIRLHVISSNSQLLPGDERCAYEKSPLIGFLRTLPLEMPWLSCRHIDLPLAAAGANSACIRQELTDLQKDPEVAYREGQRWVPQLQKIDFQAAAPQPLPFKSDAMYVMSGGLGGIGTELVRFLLSHCRIRLLIVGRTAASEQTDQALQLLQQLGGQVMYRSADISDPVRLRQVVEDAAQQWQCELDGVIHLAGVFEGNLCLEESRGSLMAALRAKMSGTWTLYQLIANRPGSLFIGFGSVNGWFGGVTAGAYGAANRFLSSFVLGQQRMNPCPLSHYVLSWSMWDEVGMSRGYPLKSWSQSLGYELISLQQGLASFRAGLSHHEPDLIVGLDGHNPYLQGVVQTDTYGRSCATAYFTRNGGTPAPTDLTAMPLTDRFGVAIPLEAILLDEMPLTPSGQIDFNALEYGPEPQLPPSESLALGDPLPSEAELKRVFADVLGVEQVDRHDNFFELGGHSLLAMRLLIRIGEVLGVKVPLGQIFETPTVAGMAYWFHTQSAEPRLVSAELPGCLILIQSEGDQRPFFCVHPGGGNPMCYVDLARHLGTDRPFYGFQSPSFLDRGKPLGCVEEIAASYIEAMRAAQPCGPYLLGGWSFGAVVAYEMARQLEAQGETVALLAMLDGGLIESRQRNRLLSTAMGLGLIMDASLSTLLSKPPASYADLRRLAQWLGADLPISFRSLVQGGAATWWQLAWDVGSKLGRTIKLWQDSAQVMRRYEPAPYCGRVSLFRSRAYVFKRDPLLHDLQKFVTDVEVYRVPGNHMTFLQDERHVQVLARHLRECLTRADP